jgi:hypothetical protein
MGFVEKNEKHCAVASYKNPTFSSSSLDVWLNMSPAGIMSRSLGWLVPTSIKNVRLNTHAVAHMKSPRVNGVREVFDVEDLLRSVVVWCDM